MGQTGPLGVSLSCPGENLLVSLTLFARQPFGNAKSVDFRNSASLAADLQDGA